MSNDMQYLLVCVVFAQLRCLCFGVSQCNSM